NGPASNITGNTFKNVYLGVFNQGSGIASRMNIVNQNHFIRNSGINSMDGIFIRSNTLLKTKIIHNTFDMNAGSGILSRANDELLIESNTFHNRSTSGNAFKAVGIHLNRFKTGMVINNDVY